MKKLLALSVAAAFAFGSTSADAQVVVPNGTYSGGSSFATSMTGGLSYAAGLLTLTIQNNGPGVFAAVGLVNYPGSSIGPGSAPTGWSWNATSQFGGAGLPGSTWAWIAPPPAPNTGVQPNAGSSTFTFNVGSATYDQLRNVGFGVHAISGPGGCSTKFAIWDGGSSNNDVGASGYDQRCTAVPEPMTAPLVAVGLLGMVFIARRRERLDDVHAA